MLCAYSGLIRNLVTRAAKKHIRSHFVVAVLLAFIILIRGSTVGLFWGGPEPPFPVISGRFGGSWGVLGPRLAEKRPKTDHNFNPDFSFLLRPLVGKRRYLDYPVPAGPRPLVYIGPGYGSQPPLMRLPPMTVSHNVCPYCFGICAIRAASL